MSPPKLKEIDLGQELRRIEFQPIVSVWLYLGFAAFGVVSILVGIGVIPIGGGRPGMNDTETMKWLGLGLGGGLLIVDGVLFAAMSYLDGQQLRIFAGGVCWEWKNRQECYLWKDVRKIVHFSSDPRVFWLHFDSGRKVA